MTTDLVVPVMDTVVSALEKLTKARAKSYGKHLVPDLESDVLLALLSERAELKRDAERYRFIRDDVKSPIYCREIEFYKGHPCGAHNVKDGQLDAAIDQAMQERQK